jgi:hypothetical protein
MELRIHNTRTGQKKREKDKMMMQTAVVDVLLMGTSNGDPTHAHTQPHYGRPLIGTGSQLDPCDVATTAAQGEACDALGAATASATPNAHDKQDKSERVCAA